MHFHFKTHRECLKGLKMEMSTFPGVVQQMYEGLFLLGDWWEYRLSAVSAPHPPDHQRLPDHSATQPQPQARYRHLLIIVAEMKDQYSIIQISAYFLLSFYKCSIIVCHVLSSSCADFSDKPSAWMTVDTALFVMSASEAKEDSTLVCFTESRDREVCLRASPDRWVVETSFFSLFVHSHA